MKKSLLFLLLFFFVILFTLKTNNVNAEQSTLSKYILVQETDENVGQPDNNLTSNENNNDDQQSTVNNQDISEDDFQKLINISDDYYQHMTKLIGVFNLDVYNFFDIHNQSYNQLSPLKKRVYERSPEYKKLLEKLKILKKRLMEAEFILHIPYQREYFFEGLQLKSEYNVRRKHFELFIGKRNMVTKSLAGPWIQSKLPITTYEVSRTMQSISSTQYSESFLGVILKMPLRHYFAGESNAVIFTSTNLILYHDFKVSEQTALKIEEKGKVKIFFRLSGGIKMLRQDNLTTPVRYYYFMTQKNRIEIIHSETNEMLYRMQY